MEDEEDAGKMDCTALDCIVCRVCVDGGCITICLFGTWIYGFWERMADYPSGVCDRAIY